MHLDPIAQPVRRLHRRSSWRRRRILLLLLGPALVLSACGSGPSAVAEPVTTPTTVADDGSLSAPDPTPPSTTPPDTEPDTVPDTVPMDTVPSQTVPATPVDPAPETTTAVPTTLDPTTLDPTTLDPCTVLDVAEVAAALGGELGPVVPSSGAGGRYRDCTWSRADDELEEVRVAINNDPASYDPAGWTRGEIIAVDGLGDASYLSTDFGVRIGFLRSGVAVTVAAPIDPATAPVWIEIARLVDSRLTGATPMPGGS